MPLATMLASVGATLACGREVIAFVLESDVSAATKSKIEASIKGTPIQLEWLTIDPGTFGELSDGFRPFDWFTVEIYYRFLLPFLLDGEIEKVIYLDSDIVLAHDLGALWDLEIGDAYVLAIADADPAAHLVSSPKGIRFFKELGLKPEVKFFNSGVLVINLRRWRSDNLPLRAISYLREAGDEVLWYDQEALNAAMGGEWTEVDPRWNYMMQFQGRCADRDTAAAPFLVHYTGATKPWHADYRHGFRRLFFENLDRTAWAGWRPRHLPMGRAQSLAKLAIKAIRKRRHAFDRYLTRRRQHRHARRVLLRPLGQLTPDPIGGTANGEIRLFVVGAVFQPYLPELVQYHLQAGCDRAFIALPPDSPNVRDETRHDPRVHLFSRDGDLRSDHEVLRYMLHEHGRGHWCLVLTSEELLASQGETGLWLKDLTARMEAEGSEALRCHVVDSNANPASLIETGMRATTDQSDLQAIRTIARDPLNQRVFGATIEVARGAPWTAGATGARTKVALLRHHAEVCFAQDLRAVSGCREAKGRGMILRFHDAFPQAPMPDRNASDSTSLSN